MSAAPRRRHGLLPVGLAVVLGLASACGDASSSAGPTPGPSAGSGGPAPVVLSAPASTAPSGPITIGVLVSLTSAPGQGSDDVTRAEGAQVAAYRLGLGGTRVTLVVLDDHGTADGAAAAVRTLVGRKVAGIVAATTGTHLNKALKAATAADTAVLMPYYRTPDRIPDGVWMTGPDQAEVGSHLEDALHAQHLSRPFVVHADGVKATGVGSGGGSAVYDGTSLPKLIARISAAVRGRRADSVVVAASAPTQAAIVGQLQGKLGSLPVLLTPEALSPVFARDLAAGDGTTAGRFETVGVDASDTTTLSQTPQANGVASFFAALRLAAGDATLHGFFGGTPFADDAADADTSSHDAVVALVAAVEAAHSTDAAKVRTALSGLTVTAADGLAGPDLTFSSDSALPADAVVTLRATTQDPGVRPPAPTGAGSGADASLFWFSVPASGS